jgi:hypothetical protein
MAVETWLGGRGEIQSKGISTDKSEGIAALPRNSEFLKLKMREDKWLSDTRETEIVLNQQALALYKNPVVGSIINITVGKKNIWAKIVGVTQQFGRPKIYIDIQQYDSFNKST